MVGDDHRAEDQPSPEIDRPLFLGTKEVEAVAGLAKFIALLVSLLSIIFAILGIYLVDFSGEVGPTHIDFGIFELNTNSVGLASIGIGAIFAILGIRAIVQLLREAIRR